VLDKAMVERLVRLIESGLRETRPGPLLTVVGSPDQADCDLRPEVDGSAFGADAQGKQRRHG